MGLPVPSSTSKRVSSRMVSAETDPASCAQDLSGASQLQAPEAGPPNGRDEEEDEGEVDEMPRGTATDRGGASPIPEGDAVGVEFMKAW